MQTSLTDKISGSFRNAMSGKEVVNNLIYWWGGIAYVTSYFIINPIILKFDSAWIDVPTAVVAMIYFIWHIYVLKKCTPKTKTYQRRKKDYAHQSA